MFIFKIHQEYDVTNEIFSRAVDCARTSIVSVLYDFDATVALHPSAAEELVTMRTKWTPHSGSLGVIEIPRSEYLKRLAAVVDLPVTFGEIA